MLHQILQVKIDRQSNPSVFFSQTVTSHLSKHCWCILSHINMARLSCTSVQSVVSNATSIWSNDVESCDPYIIPVKPSRQHFTTYVQEILPQCNCQLNPTECTCDLDSSITDIADSEELVTRAISHTVSAFLGPAWPGQGLGRRPACIGEESPSGSEQDLSMSDLSMSDISVIESEICCVRVSKNKTVTRKLKSLRKYIKSKLCVIDYAV